MDFVPCIAKEPKMYTWLSVILYAYLHVTGNISITREAFSNASYQDIVVLLPPSVF